MLDSKTKETKADISMRILVVEDDRESGLALSVMLKRRGIDVALEPSAEEALQRYRNDKFDAILSDIRLTGMSGVDLLRHVRDDDADFPFILITGYDSMQSAREAIRLGAQDYILKPLNTVEDVVAPLRKAVQSHRLVLRNKILERELAESEAKLRDVMENSLDILFRFNTATDRFDLVSPAASRILGYDGEMMNNISWEEVLQLVHPGDKEQLSPRIDTLWSPVKPSSNGERNEETGMLKMELRVRGTDERYRWLSITCRRSDPHDDGPATIVGVGRDITREKEREELEMNLRERLERAERMQSLGLLAGGVAHDLNNVLTPMLGVPEMAVMCLDEEPVDRDGIKELLRMMETSALQSKEIIRNLLTLSRRGNFQPNPVDVNEAIADFLASVTLRDCQENRPRVTFDADVPKRLGTIMGSSSHLVQLLTNLVLNAFEAIPEAQTGTVRLSADVVELDEPYIGYETVPAGEYVTLQVSDDGAGIEQRSMKHIFEPFYTRKRMGKTSGSGLGLAVVYGVLQDHRGYVDVTSTYGQGACFTIYLPRGAAPQHPDTRPGQTKGGSESILVVDDQAQQREIASRLLRRLGYEVTVMASGRDLVEHFRQHAAKRSPKDPVHPFDLVLLDMIIEDGFDGLDTYRAALEYAPEQPCILISGFSETDRVKEAMRLGAGQYLQKPYTLTELAQAVRAELDRPVESQ